MRDDSNGSKRSHDHKHLCFLLVFGCHVNAICKMGGLTQKNKRSSSNMFRRGLKCTVHIEIRSITCPGVVIANQEEVYLSVCIMGQFKKTLSLPPVFPLLFHEKMLFVKTFPGVADPGHVANLLEADTTSFQLIQLVPPDGDSLATIEENTRDFLYPGSKLTLSPRAGGPSRQMLMRRSISFPGISPKVEFASTSIIEECDWTDSQPQPAFPPCRSPSFAKRSPGRQRQDRGAAGSPEKPLKGKELNGSAASSGYRKPTVASQTRALSPYTHRRMCQLSEEARERLSHFHLGPYTFKKETERQVPFVVSRTPNASTLETPRLSSIRNNVPHSRSTSLAADLSGSESVMSDSSLFGSYRPVRKSSGKSSSTPVRLAGSAMAAQCSSPADGRRTLQHSPLLSRSSLRERFHSALSPSEEIHNRVQKILHTHGTVSKQHLDKDVCWTKPRPQLSHEDSCNGQIFQDRVSLGEASVHLDNGMFWSSQAASYTGKPHRAVFEESLGHIYKNMYRRASSAVRSTVT
ncbi:hypothetical protein DPEC_G00341590 [Dallia pectoralis]|uniref:Uncharacterized protein n=1 Tax=Dallia pectoralis TaxID=75939 RepID=A0ACC2F5E0_DALPE|nr:hypothetical protein DPEC_G00341590 [Dallia pectoralis]